MLPKGKTKNQLPVFWRSNRKEWVTAAVFLDWFNNRFVHEVERYLKEIAKCYRFSTMHPESLVFAHPNLKSSSPPNATSLLQPMDLGVIEKFKSCYTHRTFDHIADLIEKSPHLMLKEAWKGYTIAHALTIIKTSWDEIKQSTLNAAWWKRWPQVVNYFAGFPTVEETFKNCSICKTFGGRIRH